MSKLKALLGRAKARTKEALVEAIGQAQDKIVPEDARGWYVRPLRLRRRRSITVITAVGL